MSRYEVFLDNWPDDRLKVGDLYRRKPFTPVFLVLDIGKESHAILNLNFDEVYLAQRHPVSLVTLLREVD